MQVCDWLDSTSADTAAYFEQCVAVYEVLVQGRNLKNTPPMQELLPYSVVTKLITHGRLHEKHLAVSAQFVTVARALYVDNEPHQIMTRVRSIRIWENIHSAALSGKLSSRLVTSLDIDWSKFDELKEFIAHYLSALTLSGQVATHLEENHMMLELVKLLYHLVQSGFYTSDQVGTLLPVLLDALDGTHDRVGLAPGWEDPKQRYEQIKTIRVNTVEIMECKHWLCRILQLVVTMRLDIRLSLFLDKFQRKWNSGDFGNEPVAVAAQAGGRRRSITDHVLAIANNVRRGSVQAAGYLRLTDPNESEANYDKIFEVLRLDVGSSVDVVQVLLDLTFYDHPELVTAAMGLLVRHFEQRSVLVRLAREARLLVKDNMVGMYRAFDELLRRLRFLAARRRLFEDEPYAILLLICPPIPPHRTLHRPLPPYHPGLPPARALHWQVPGGAPHVDAHNALLRGVGGGRRPARTLGAGPLVAVRALDGGHCVHELTLARWLPASGSHGVARFGDGLTDVYASCW